MSAKVYHFVTVWHFTEPVAKVWPALIDPLKWPEWWSGLVASQPGIGVSNAPNAQTQLHWRAPLGYALSFELTVTESQESRYLEFTAAGDLQGSGSCTLVEAAGDTKVTIIWEVATTKAWMNHLSFLLGPIFRLNHSWLMAAGRQGLGRYLSKEAQGLPAS